MKKINTFKSLMEDRKYRDAYKIGAEMFDDCWSNNDFLRRFVSCAIFYNRKRVTLKLIDKILKENEVSPTVYKLSAGLSYHLKNEEDNRKRSFIMAKEHPLWKKTEYKNAKMNVVVLYAAVSGSYKYQPRSRGFTFGGNCNLSGYIAEDINVYRVWADDFEAAKKCIKSLGNINVIYNSITEPEKCQEALESAVKICDYFENLGVPIINKPENVFTTNRDLQQKQFAGMRHIKYPKNVKLFNVTGNSKELINKAILDNDLSYPIIVRLAGYSAGNYMHLLEKENENDFSDFDNVINESNPKDIYLIDYVDVSFKDKEKDVLYPKYRAILMGGKLYPVHLRIAKDYAVFHSNSKACMDKKPWLIQLSEKYSSKPTDVVDPKLWKAIEKMLKMTGLDYVAIDFSIAKNEDGAESVVVFETSAGAHCWLDKKRAYVNVRVAWEKIVRRFCRLLCEKSGVEMWHFQLPKKLQ